MNLKERGITVGDLLILALILVLTTFILKKLDKEKQSMIFPIEINSSRHI